MRANRILLPAALLAVAVGVGAQSPAPDAQPLPADTAQHGQSQRIERIELEDAGSRIDELREGGQTRTITVQPKARVPSYDVQPAGSSADNREAGPGSAGRRTWKILNF